MLKPSFIALRQIEGNSRMKAFISSLQSETGEGGIFGQQAPLLWK